MAKRAPRITPTQRSAPERQAAYRRKSPSYTFKVALPGRRVLSWLLIIIAGSVLAISLPWLLQPRQWTIEQVEVHAWQADRKLRYVSASQLRDSLDSLLAQGRLYLDREALQRVLEQLRWVERARVEWRGWNRLVIFIKEPDIAAYWLDNREASQSERVSLLSTSGQPLSLPRSALPAGLQVPTLRGPSGQQAALWELYQQLQRISAANAAHITWLELNQERAYRAVLDDGVLLLLENLRPQRSLQRFILVYRQLSEAQRAAIMRVDLRYPNGLAIQSRVTSSLSQTAALRNQNA